MSTTTPTDDEGTATDQLPNDVLPLGVDGEGNVHHYTRREHLVVVETPSGHVERREELDDRPLEEWIEFVEDEDVGWETLNYADCFADVLTEAL